jgi:hypothetical protein
MIIAPPTSMIANILAVLTSTTTTQVSLAEQVAT